MPRPTKPRSIGRHTEENMKDALKKIKSGMSVRKTSQLSNIPFTTLRRYYLKSISSKTIESIRLVPNYEVNKVFNDEQELSLKQYFKHCSSLFYGLTAKDCRRVAYQMADINKLKMPDSWINNQMAGKEWLRSFRRRHNDLSLRKPEPCSLARATAFNRTNVESFYKNLEDLMARNPLFKDGTRIFNLDETSTTTVQKPQRVIAPKGRQNVGKVTSGERGTLVTTCCIISASGLALPPVMVFPRKNFKNFMIRNTPPGTLGLAASSGWMNTEIFPEVMKHFIKFSHSSPENPSILIMDNHESHLSLEALNLAKNSGVHVLTLHPHTSAKLQPLDVGIYGPFKTYYNAAIDSWLLRNPGKPISIYEIGEVVGIAFLKVMTPVNIINAFKKCGVFPFDRHIFSDDDFMPSSVTDRPYPDNKEQEPIRDPRMPGPSCSNQPTDEMYSMRHADRIDSDETDCSEEDMNIFDQINSLTDAAIPLEQNRENSPSTLPDSVSLDQHSAPVLHQQLGFTAETSQLSTVFLHSSLTTQQPTESNVSPLHSIDGNVRFLTPFEFRDPIKAAPRKPNRRPRKLGRSMIATDTPEKNEIELAKASKKKMNAKEKKIVRKVLVNDSDEENGEIHVQYQESDDDNEWPDEDMEIETVGLTENDLKEPLPRPPIEGEFVLVKFATKKQKIYYIGKILEGRNENLEYFISFLRKKAHNKFNMPTIPDLSSVKEHDINYILPKPTVGGSTTRQQSYYYFSTDLSQLNVH